MVHKFRKAMGKRDDRYTLKLMIEMDESCFTVASCRIELGKGKRGRGTADKSNVAVI